MKILYYSPHPQLRMDAPTGYGTHIREMIAAWRRMGVEVKTVIAGDVFLSSDNIQPVEPKSRYAGIKSFMPSIVWESVRDFALRQHDRKMESHLIKILADFEPDYIYERVNYLQNSGIRAARKMNVKHIAEINAPYPEERIAFSGKSLFIGKARKSELAFLDYSSGISVVSSALKKYLTNIRPEAEPKIRVVPNAVNPELAKVNLHDIEALRQTYGLDGKVVVGFVGSIFPYHGVDILIDAFGKLPAEHNAQLLIVGDGSVLPELKAQAKRLGVLDRIVFTGSVPYRKVYPLIRVMDICCMPKSNWYGSPVKIFEYALFKKPVIAPDVSPVRDVMSESEGLFVQPQILAFYDALVHLIHNKTDRIQLGENWNKKVLENYTWDNAAQNTLKLCT